MKVALILDTNKIYAHKIDSYLEFKPISDFNELIKFKNNENLFNLDFFISKITLMEIINQKIINYNKKKEELYKLIEYFNCKNHKIKINDEKYYQRYFKKNVEEFFEKNDIKIIKYRNIKLDKIIERALKHKNPFAKDGDKGFKDTIIWESIRNNEIIDTYDLVYFFTDDNGFDPKELKKENNKIKIVRNLDELKKYILVSCYKLCIKKVIDKENLLNIFREENPDVVDIKDMFKSIRNSSNNIIEVEATLIKNYNGIKEEFEQTYYFYKNTNFISLNNYEEEKYD